MVDKPQSRHGSSRTGTSERARRQRALEADLAAAERFADLERREIEIDKRLLEKQNTIARKLAELDDDHEDDLLDRRTTSSLPSRNCQYDTARNCDPKDKIPSKGNTSTNANPQIEKFMSRQIVKELPLFSGAPEEWLLFYSQFEVTTRLCGYSEIENIARLSRCLRGEARDSVYALLTSASNLDRIIDTLKLRFGRPDIIINSMISKVQSHRYIRHDDMKHLLLYATDIQNMAAIMVSTDQIEYLQNPILINEVLSKLPSNLKIQWGLDKSRRGLFRVTLEDVADWLMEVAKSTVEFTTPITRTVDKKDFYQNKGGKHFPVMTTGKTPFKHCHKCKRDHHLSDCNDFLRLSLEDRWRYVTESKLCFSCLSCRHQLRECDRKLKCSVSGCERIHHRLLHAEPRRTESTPQCVATQIIEPSTDDALVATTQPIRRSSRVMLKVIKVVVRGRHGDFETSALLDEGAAVSLIDTSFAKLAGIDGPTQPLHMRGAHGMTSVDSTSRCVTFKIRGRNSHTVYNLLNVRTCNNLNLPLNSFDMNIVNRFNFITDYFDISDLTFDKVDILIGQDNIDLIITRQIVQGPRHGPTISLTNLGYVLHGTVTDKNLPIDVPVLHCTCDDLNELYRQTFRTEDFGVKTPIDCPRSREDLKALDIMRATTHYIAERKRWETGLLWRNDKCILPDSFDQAFVRFQGTKRKMAKFPEFAEKYQQKIEDYERKGYARRLTAEEAQHRTDRTWYLPHFAVYNPNKPNKLRFVTDAAAKSSSKSLNDFLLSGPDYLNSLPGMLLQFRCHRYAVMGDIQEMFHQVLIIEQDQYAQRFLWGDGQYQMNVMIFGAVCSPSSAQYVKNVNALRFSDSHPEAVKAIVDHHYMDDLILSIDTIDQGIKLVDDVIYIHAEGGFNMTSFMSNSKDILRHLPGDKLSTSGAKVLNDIPDLPLERVLGVKWRPSDDVFVYSNLGNLIDEQDGTRPTKRHILKVCMSIFDPLGFLLFVVIKVRILLQDVWKTKIGWDDEVTGDLYDRWQSLLQELRRTIFLQIPRWFLILRSDIIRPVEVHVFCDASTRAFAAVAYMRSVLDDGSYHVSLIMARGRVAPLKILSVPRLELQGSLLGARMAQTIKKYVDLTISRVMYWSDSKTVLNWIRSDAGRFKPFVAHRISEISDLTDPSEWRWVPTHKNLADYATREKTPDDVSSLWVNGPDFLKQDESTWPVEGPTVTEVDSKSDVEVKPTFVFITDASYESSPDVTRFSQYWRLVRATAWILRFTFNLIHKDRRKRAELLSDEIEKAELILIRDSQRRSFPNDFLTLQRKDSVDKNSCIFQLVPFIDTDGLIRARGRIDTAFTDYNVKNPIVLLPTDGFTKLLVMQYHKYAAHSGKEKVLNDIRQKFWILRGRSAVRAVWYAVCRMLVKFAKIEMQLQHRH